MYFTTSLIGRGTGGEVWALNDEKLVAKTFFKHSAMKHECKVIKKISKIKGLNIPKLAKPPIQKVLVKRTKKGLFRKTVKQKEEDALVMQRLYGLDIHQFRRNLHVISLWRTQVDIAMDNGWYPGDASSMNGIYAPKEDKVYLLDFELWMKYDQKEIDELRAVGWM